MELQASAKKCVNYKIIYMSLQTPRVCSQITYKEQGAPIGLVNKHVLTICPLTAFLRVNDQLDLQVIYSEF